MTIVIPTWIVLVAELVGATLLVAFSIFLIVNGLFAIYVAFTLRK